MILKNGHSLFYKALEVERDSATFVITLSLPRSLKFTAGFRPHKVVSNGHKGQKSGVDFVPFWPKISVHNCKSSVGTGEVTVTPYHFPPTNKSQIWY